jgi:hypothetical protein
MKEYKGDEIFKLIVDRLVCRHPQDKFDPKEYDAFLNLKTEEALDKLKPRLEELQKRYNNCESRPNLCFLDELGWYHFQIELRLVEALNTYLSRVKENKEIPILIIEDENMCVEDVIYLWEQWVEKCKAQP